MKNLFNSLAFIGSGIPLIALRFADGGGSGDGDGDKGGEKGDPGDGKGKAGSEKGGDNKGDGDKEEEKKFTQEDLDAAVEKRLARERRKWEREHPEAKKSDEDEKGQKKEEPSTDDGSAAKLAAASQKLVQAEAKAIALSLGVKPERVSYAVRMADLAKVDVDDELGADTDAIKKAIGQVLTDIPELKSFQTGSKNSPGFKVGGDGDGSGRDKDEKIKLSYRDAIAAHYKK